MALKAEKAPENLLASVEYLREKRSVQVVAPMGASAGGRAVLRAADEDPDAADELILLSATGDMTGLGEVLKLFVASKREGMAEEVRRIAEGAHGYHKEVFIAPGRART